MGSILAKTCSNSTIETFFWYLYRLGKYQIKVNNKVTCSILGGCSNVFTADLEQEQSLLNIAGFEQYFSIFWCFHFWQRRFIKYPRDQQNPSSILSAEIHYLLKTQINAALLFYSKHQARHLHKLKLSKLLNKYCLDRFKGALITSIFPCQKVLWERKMPEVFSEN